MYSNMLAFIAAIARNGVYNIYIAIYSWVATCVHTHHTSFVTVRAKTSLVHTSKFTTSVLYNFEWERSTELKFIMLVH